jgi:hypothetical protein
MSILTMMRLATRIVIFAAVLGGIADSPALLGQRGSQNPQGQGRQDGAAEVQGRGGRGGRQGGGRGETPRDRSQTQRVGTASIRGRVINLTTGTPVRRASIQANYLVAEGRGETERQGRSVTSDENGMFELAGLAAGRWNLRASKTGYVEQQYGQRSAFSSADPITLAEGQRLVADFRLSRGGAISGRVVDEFGDPLAGANVTALRLQSSPDGARTARTGTSVPSDDNGTYRIYGLPPGQYYVSVNDPSAARMIFVGLPDGNNSVQFEAGGSFVVEAGQVSLSRASGERTSYAPTYYPGTANITEAQRLTLGLGEEQSGINLTIVPIRAAKITGRVMGSNGSPLRAQVSLTSQMGQGFSPSGGRNGSSSDGAFTLNNIPPGTYTLNVLGPNVGAAPPEVAAIPIVVSGQDILDLTVITGSGASVQGMIVADGGGRLPASRLRITANPASRSPATWTPRVDANENGTFALEGLVGIYTLRFDNLPSGWMVNTVTANGLDVSDAAIEFQPADRVTIRVELTDRVTQVSGSVRPTRDIKGGTVVVFPDEPSKWTSTSRYVKTTRVGDDGRFSISGLPPHSRYLALAIDFIEPGEAQNPEFLQRAKAAATGSFGLTAGGQQILDLPLTVR